MRWDKIDGKQNANKEQDQEGREDKTGKSSVHAKQVYNIWRARTKIGTHNLRTAFATHIQLNFIFVSILNSSILQ